MKIVFYINVLSHGGAERVISNIANMMSVKRHECIMVTSYSIENEYTLEKKVRRVVLSNYEITNFFNRNIKLTYRLRQLLKKEAPDLLVSFMAEPNYRACIASLGLNVKTVLSVRNDPNIEYRGRFHAFFSKLLFRFADGIVFQTIDAMNWFPKSIRDKGVIIYNSVNESFFSKSLPIDNSGIVATGRLCAQKNHKLLIQAFSKIQDKVKDDLTIYGSGDPTELKVYAKKIGILHRVHFPGSVSDMANVLCKYKLYVLSSDYEGMPNALMEAMSIGLPCISTDCPCGGPRILFSKKMAQYLVPVGDVDSLASRILNLLQNDAERTLISSEAKKQSRLYHPSIINEKWTNYLTSFS